MKTVVITGANRGIGLELARQYKQQGDSVYALCRSPSEELNKMGVNVINGVDVGNAQYLPGALAKIDAVKIDLLINNAGILERGELTDWQPQSIEDQFRVNAMGPLLVTQCLLPQMVKGGKIAVITSRMGSMADNSSGGRYGYRMSKAALNAAAVSLAQDLKAQQIAVAILHPGFVQTDMVNGAGDVSAEQSAANLRQRIAELNLTNTGTFWHAKGDVLPW